MNIIIDYFKAQGVALNGRFGEFEYLNMDRVIEHSQHLAGEL
jgi:UDP-galactopyranose mutase